MRARSIVAGKSLHATLLRAALLGAGLLGTGLVFPGVLAPPSAASAQAAPESLRVNGDRMMARLHRLAEFGGTAGGGTSRPAFSDEDLAAREYVASLMREAGLSVAVDLVGNIVGRREGSVAGLRPLLMGSHIDSVPDGGNYDGQVGSIGAVEVAQTIAEASGALRHPLEVVIFQNEEGGKTGSRAWIGEVEEYELDIVTASGLTIREGIDVLGGDPERLAAARREPGSIAAYLELHIEQGAVLDHGDIDIGVVEGIVGIKRWMVAVDGFANHAGTTPMGARRDALLAAARLIIAVNEIAVEMPGRHVATVGRIEAFPGAANVIPGRVIASLEIRDLEMSRIEEIFGAIEQRAATIARDAGVGIAFDPFYVSRAAPTDEAIRDLIDSVADDLGLSALRMPSGAGHDAQSVALLGPVGMIFVPSRDGISHSPREHSDPTDVVAGANVLLHTVLKLDRRAP